MRPRRTSTGCVLLVLGLLALPAPLAAQAGAGPPPASLTLAFFTPQLAFPGALERSGWQSAVAAHLSAATGLTVEAKGFARAGDFRTFLHRSPGALAIADAQLALAAGWTPLLQAVSADGVAVLPLAVASLQPGTLSALQGRTLILADSGGGEKALVGGLVLAGEVPPAKFFGKLAVAPDAPSAAAAVSLGKADAALIYSFIARERGRALVLETEGAPLPLLVAAGKEPSLEVRSRVAAALAAAPAGGGIGGWRAVDGVLLARFRGRLAPSTTRPLVPASVPWLPLREVAGAATAAGELPLEPLPARQLFELPPLSGVADFLPRGQLQEGSDERATDTANPGRPDLPAPEGAPGEPAPGALPEGAGP